MKASLVLCLAAVALTAGQGEQHDDSPPPEADEIIDGWHDPHMQRVSHWAVDACEHILTVRSQGSAADTACEDFASDHTQPLAEARIKAFPGKAADVAADLCAEVVLIMAEMKDEEVLHIPTKMTYNAFCKERFALDGLGNDYLAKLKHFFVLNLRHPELERDEL